MHLLVVHHDAEVAEQLVQMVKDYTQHACDLAMSETAAMMWGSAHARCDLLITELEGPDIDGLRLGGSLSEMFPGLQTMFLPSYAAAEQRLEIGRTKVFPEPIDGELLLDAIERTAHAPAGAPDSFHVLDVLQMCCLSGRSGAVQLVRGDASGLVFLNNGRIVHAETPTARGTEALYQICGWDDVEFAYDESVRSAETITTAWDETLIQAVNRRSAARANGATAPLANSSENAEPVAPPAPRKRGLFASLLNR